MSARKRVVLNACSKSVPAASRIVQHMPKTHFRSPEGTCILQLDLRGYGLSPEEIHCRIYNDVQVMLEGD